MFPLKFWLLKLIIGKDTVVFNADLTVRDPWDDPYECANGQTIHGCNSSFIGVKLKPNMGVPCK